MESCEVRVTADAVMKRKMHHPVLVTIKETQMPDSRVALRVGLLIAAAAALAFAAVQVRDRRNVAIATVDSIEQQLASLDPVTRAAVVARLSSHAVNSIKAEHGKA